MTEAEIEKAKATFPKFTVYVTYAHEMVCVQTSDYYAAKGKTYQECSEALTKLMVFKELQDEDLYNLARFVEEKRKRETVNENLLERLREISFDIDNLIGELA